MVSPTDWCMEAEKPRSTRELRGEVNRRLDVPHLVTRMSGLLPSRRGGRSDRIHPARCACRPWSALPSCRHVRCYRSRCRRHPCRLRSGWRVRGRRGVATPVPGRDGQRTGTGLRPDHRRVEAAARAIAPGDAAASRQVGRPLLLCLRRRANPNSLADGSTGRVAWSTTCRRPGSPGPRAKCPVSSVFPSLVLGSAATGRFATTASAQPGSVATAGSGAKFSRFRPYQCHTPLTRGI
jgi:hypothetical protein